MDKLLEKQKMCFLCDNTKALEIKKQMVPCPVCCYGNFLTWNVDKELKEVQLMCADCSLPTHNRQPRCYQCYLNWKERETLCDLCGKNHHKNKYQMCFYCNFKKKIDV